MAWGDAGDNVRLTRPNDPMHTSGSHARTPPYRGRFAPSPTGPLHLGSLTAALASRLEAHRHNGTWLLRIEDIDRGREVPGAASGILHALDLHGFTWDGPVVYQKNRETAYEEAVDQLLASKLAYPCGCTRRNRVIGSLGSAIYPGTCRQGLPAGRRTRAIRARTHDRPISFSDSLQGNQEQSLESTTGDFVIRRADGWYAYQLAVVVDDAWQGITEIVRGMDLLDSTPRQLYLQHCLQLPTPHYAHLPLVVDQNGNKLSKSTGSAALDPRCPGENLWLALRLLRQNPPTSLCRAPSHALWDWARAHWSPTALQGVRTSRLSDLSA
ncbi:tRNA glutamyl-Q(34) synthetase GluQRS [Acidihalobacter yilgarnensis]|nr:tRNA glutamyl-Q(34) synthetase GluQRS [Acidihalobacter yilgarnensis]